MPEDLSHVLEIVEAQATGCGRLGSGLYERILEGVAADLRAGGVSASILSAHAADPHGSMVALRLMGAVHRIVLEGRARALGSMYPSVGGDPASGDPVSEFLRVLEHHREEIQQRLSDGVQTNEVGRAAVLAGGYALVQQRTGLPLRLLEVGASAGLNLRFDHYAYDTGERVAGDSLSPVRFEDVWVGAPPALPACFEVVERSGCDRNPLDPSTEEGRVTLLAYTWPDQTARIELLQAALEVAGRVHAPVAKAEAAEWTEAQLASPRRGVATVIAHSIVLQYLAPARRRRFRGALAAAGRTATDDAPLAWLRMEPAGDRAELRLTTWPGGVDEPLATAGYHGRPIWWGA